MRVLATRFALIVGALACFAKVDATIGAPQVAFRERVTKRVGRCYTHKKQTGGTGRFARVTLIGEPKEPGKGY